MEVKMNSSDWDHSGTIEPPLHTAFFNNKHVFTLTFLTYYLPVKVPATIKAAVTSKVSPPQRLRERAEISWSLNTITELQSLHTHCRNPLQSRKLMEKNISFLIPSLHTYRRQCAPFWYGYIGWGNRNGLFNLMHTSVWTLSIAFTVIENIADGS